MSKHDLTAEILREWIDYDPETGAMRWRKKPAHGGVKQGDKAGRVNEKGYVRICLLGHFYVAHRLVWLHATGRWPEHQIDHINGQKTDNRLANLRDVSASMNCQNRRAPAKAGKKEPLGVCWNKKERKFQASIYVDGRLRHLGLHETADAAHAVYVAAKREHHEGNTL